MTSIDRSLVAFVMMLLTLGCSSESDDDDKGRNDLSPREKIEQKTSQRLSTIVERRTSPTEGHQIFLNGIHVPSRNFSSSARMKVEDVLVSQGLQTGLSIENQVKRLIVISEGVVTSPIESEAAVLECAATSGIRAFRHFKEMSQGSSINESIRGPEAESSNVISSSSEKIATASGMQSYTFSSSSSSSRTVFEGRVVDKSIDKISMNIGSDFGCSYRSSAEEKKTIWTCDIEPMARIFNSRFSVDKSLISITMLTTEIGEGHCASAFAFQFPNY